MCEHDIRAEPVEQSSARKEGEPRGPSSLLPNHDMPRRGAHGALGARSAHRIFFRSKPLQAKPNGHEPLYPDVALRFRIEPP
jgi:hypothetical protein